MGGRYLSFECEHQSHESKELLNITSARAVFGSISAITVMIRVSLLFIYTSIHFRLEYTQGATINRMAFGSTLEVTPIQKNSVKQGKRDVISRHLHARNDKEKSSA